MIVAFKATSKNTTPFKPIREAQPEGLIQCPVNGFFYAQNMDNQDPNLKIVDINDGRTLTTEEIAELKRLVSMSRAAKVIIWGLFGIVGAIGADKVIDFFSSHWK